MVTPSFNGLRVLTLESRRSSEMAALVSNYGGQPLSAPALREVPLDTNTEAFAFIDSLLRHEFDLVILLTGVGTRALLAVVDRRGLRSAFLAALGSTRIAARGPKPVAVLRELGLTPWVVAPEPNTWKELIAALDAKAAELTLRGARVAVQEYGTSNAQLLDGLRERGAGVVSVPVYRYALPDDLGPLEAAVRAVAGRDLDVVLFTTATQVVHLLDVARRMNVEPAVRQGLAAMAVASIGPTTSEELREQGIAIDIEASHPKMGFLVRDAAERAAGVLRTKGGGAAVG
ncbi:MAG TPA: uroporphyrinogen-III synthase [Vicinamibacterales bacterium]|nr:uroporphyrinogen-III synthase [Vicinamibacterales bacterium]